MALGATTAMNRVRFPLGAIVYHHKQGYRGVIFGVDAEFALSDEWYDRVAQSRPPRMRPGITYSSMAAAKPPTWRSVTWFPRRIGAPLSIPF